MNSAESVDDAVMQPLKVGDTVVATGNYLDTKDSDEIIGKVLAIGPVSRGFQNYRDIMVQFATRIVRVLSDDLLVVHDPNLDRLVDKYPYQ